MKKLASVFILVWIALVGLQAQNEEMMKEDTGDKSRKLQYFSEPGFKSLNEFETPKSTSVEYDGLKVRVGGDFALQFQALDHSNAAGAPQLIPLGNNINLPSANLNLDVQLHRGVRMHLRTYLSSRHHNETWVKGGYIQMDQLDFISDDFLSGLMDIASFRIGMEMPNYGDAHFRRSDNANAIQNPFVGNYIMDAHTTEPFIEATFQPGDFLVVAGATNGLFNPTVNNSYIPWGSEKYAGELDDFKPTYYGKLGWDSQLNQDIRVRLTGSFYTAQGTDNGDHLYSGDRAGARYYHVMDYVAADSTVVTDFRSGRFNPGFVKEMAFQVNPFVKFKGLEFFGVFEQTTGTDGSGNRENGQFTQLGAELLYRFGSWDQFYVGSRFNRVSGYGDYASGGTQPDTKLIDRVNVGGGWFLTKNTLVKLEYVMQQYNENFKGTWGNPDAPTNLTNGKFNGFVLESVISF